MNHPRHIGILLVALVAAGCNSNSHLPKPRPPEIEIENNSPSPATDSTSAAPAAGAVPQPSSRSTDATAQSDSSRPTIPAESDQTSDAGTGVDPVSDTFVLADPDALKLEIEPIIRGQQLPAAERRRLSIQRMRKISAAIAAYAKDKGHLPPLATYDDERCPMLSWRVLVLPYLGHSTLYSRFKLHEPYNSPTNGPLLSVMPAVYQSPDRPDEKTNYLAPVVPGGAFRAGQQDGLPIESLAGDLGRTVVVVEVDHPMAVAWTRPVDYRVHAQDPRRGLKQMREDGFFFGWGDGSTACWPLDAPSARFVSLFTLEGQKQGLREMSKKAVVNLFPPTGDLVQQDGNGVVAGVVAGGVSAVQVASIDTAVPPASPVQPAEKPLASSSPTPNAKPSPATYDAVLSALRETYSADYDEMTTPEKRAEFVRRLLVDAGNTADSAEQFVLLDVARKVAVQAGDIAGAFESIDTLAGHFEIDSLGLQAEALEQTARMPLEESDNTLAMETAERLIDAALAEDRYETAIDLYAAALAAARRSKDHRKIAELGERREDISRARRQYDQVRETLDAGANGPEANLTVGVHLCFVKQQWSRGLPLLAKCSDPRLASIAGLELAPSHDATEAVELADDWWKLAEDYRDYQRACEQRAEYWYHQAIQQGLPEGLPKVRAEMRLRQLERE